MITPKKAPALPGSAKVNITRAERSNLVADGSRQNVSAVEVLLRQLDGLSLRQKRVGPAISCWGQGGMNAGKLDVARQCLCGQCASLRR